MSSPATIDGTEKDAARVGRNGPGSEVDVIAGSQVGQLKNGLVRRGIRRLRRGAAWRLARLHAAVSEVWLRNLARSELALRWQIGRAGRPHRLPGELIVSLTSYPARYETLALTLRCLLSQSVKADRTILWIAHEDMASLPTEVTDLTSAGLEIRACKNNRSYKKIIPALAEFPKAFVATADDDVYYSRRWLEEMVLLGADGTIVCHRAHTVTFDETGDLAPYGTWNFDHAAVPQIVFPTGVGGVLYAPDSLAPEVLDEDEFMQLCPSADDVWLFWMGRRAGSKYVTPGANWTPIPWEGTQTSALYLTNVGQSANDEQIARMIRRYGSPFDYPVRNRAA